MNGQAIDTTIIAADGNWKDIHFQYPVKQSSWIALRVYQSSHTNPVFIILNGKPVQIRKSAEWCRRAVDQCWKMKQANIRTKERSAAEAAYNDARKIYDRIIHNSSEKE